VSSVLNNRQPNTKRGAEPSMPITDPTRHYLKRRNGLRAALALVAFAVTMVIGVGCSSASATQPVSHHQAWTRNVGYSGDRTGGYIATFRSSSKQLCVRVGAKNGAQAESASVSIKSFPAKPGIDTAAQAQPLELRAYGSTAYCPPAGWRVTGATLTTTTA
jgi:hypothetical protein